MLIEQPPLLYRLLFPEAIWRVKRPGEAPVAYITFDDGPIPEVTPWVLDILDQFGVKATFFMVGDNVRRNPDLLAEVLRRGHSVGNHTMHHIQGLHTSTADYLADVDCAASLISTTLFRPPHGIIRWKQGKKLKEKYNVIMYDLVTRDYSRKLTPERVLDNVHRYARNGSIIVFHDSLKAEKNLRYALPRALVWLMEQGFRLEALPM